MITLPSGVKVRCESKRRYHCLLEDTWTPQARVFLRTDNILTARSNSRRESTRWQNARRTLHIFDSYARTFIPLTPGA